MSKFYATLVFPDGDEVQTEVDEAEAGSRIEVDQEMVDICDGLITEWSRLVKQVQDYREELYKGRKSTDASPE